MIWRASISFKSFASFAATLLFSGGLTVLLIPQAARALSQEDRQGLRPLPRPQYVRADKLADPVLYKEIFALQENAKWRRADQLIRQVEDPLLMGHVLFQRYMHPTSYRAKWTELRDWLKNYADHPGAWRAYKLAQKRKPRGIAMPKRPPARIYHQDRASSGSPLFKTRSRARIRREVYRLIRRERPTQALKYISAKSQDRRLQAAETDFLKSLISRSYYIEGKIASSLKLAREATRSRKQVPMSDWQAGLAAWRLGNRDLATDHFRRLANTDTISSALRARAAYWTARGLRAAGKISEAEPYLKMAAESGPYFYALLGMQQVEGQLQISWQQAARRDADIFATHPVLRRAEALRAAGQGELAELELLYLQERLSEPEARAMLAYAEQNDYPAVQLAVAHRLGLQIRGGVPLNVLTGSYPTLPKQATTKVDQAILLALVRQESRFKARAKSSAGARGLMQIMPRTAAFITGDRKLAWRKGRDQLLKADLNLAIGQKYLSMLMGRDYFDGNLIFALAAYNAGPGTLRRWRRELKDVEDPLLFIESMSAGETRKYVQKVMANMWIYRNKFGQDPISLRILAAESWPQYVQQDTRAKLVPALISN